MSIMEGGLLWGRPIFLNQDQMYIGYKCMKTRKKKKKKGVQKQTENKKRAEFIEIPCKTSFK